MNKVLNNVIISLLVFFLTFCWMQYYSKIPTLSTLTAIGAAVVCCIIIQILSKKPSMKERKAAKRGEI
jgi:predicted phage tail protein